MFVLLYQVSIIQIKHINLLLIKLLGGLVLTYQEARSTNFDSLVLAGKIDVPNTPSSTTQEANTVVMDADSVANKVVEKLSNKLEGRIDNLEKKLDVLISLLSA